jgi:hypothetical protein
MNHELKKIKKNNFVSRRKPCFLKFEMALGARRPNTPHDDQNGGKRIFDRSDFR